MTSVRFTRSAREDLLDIWLYIAPRNSTAVADWVCDRIEQACQLLQQKPRMGNPRPEISKEARALIVERWLVLYRLVEDGVQVVRIVDGVRDLTRIGWSPD